MNNIGRAISRLSCRTPLVDVDAVLAELGIEFVGEALDVGDTALCAPVPLEPWLAA